MNYKELTILIAEDDDGHAELIKEGLTDNGINNEIIRFSDGQQVWDFLSGKASENKRDKNKQYLLLLDINMPRMNGVEVLKRMKSDEELKDIPIVMLTTTDDPREVEDCYHNGCNIYITKPVEFLKFTETLRRLSLFIQIVKI